MSTGNAECGHYHFDADGSGLTDPRRERAIAHIEAHEGLMEMATCPGGFGLEAEIEYVLGMWDEHAYERAHG